MQVKEKILFYFTASYPFGNGEQFIENEILELSNYFKKIYVIPFNSIDGKQERNLPENTVVISDIKKESQNGKRILLINPILTIKIILSEIFQKNGSKALLNINNKLKEISNAIEISKEIKNKSIKLNQSDIFYYSTWMNEWALALSILFNKKEISKFSFKMRGYDLFDERWPHNHLPFRNFIFKNSSCKITMSFEGMKYLKAKGYNKIKVNYPGLNFNRSYVEKTTTDFLLVSCSNLIPLKRVDLIAKSLTHISINLKWIHFGNGPEMENIRSITNNLPPNINVELKGNVPNTEVISFYENNFVDAFIHLSLSEGFGFSVAEAFSFGIPAILYPGGAIKELIDENYCATIDSDENPIEIGKKIETFLIKNKSNIEIRRKIIDQNKQKFDVKICGENLFNLITQ